MSLFSRLFGGGAKPGPEPETYKGFRIYPEPQSGAGGFRLAARIEGEVDGVTKTHHMIRADTVASREEAEGFAIRKARQLIDEQGARLFG